MVRPQELISRRRSMEMTQAELATELEVSANTVARWERGERAIPPYLKLALDTIEQNLMNLTPIEAYRHNQQIIERHQREAAQRWEQMTPEEKAAVERWFGEH